MNRTLRVLVIEDSETDMKLIARELERSGGAVEIRRVEDAQGMRAALAEEHGWDVIVSDWSLPHFSGSDALMVLRETGRDIPFIIVSGSIGEDAAVEAMRAGAHDYVLKDRLARLSAAVRREVRERDVRALRLKAEEALRASEERYRRIVETSNEGVWIIDAEARTTFANARLAQMLGYETAEIVGRPVYDFLVEEAREPTRRNLEERRTGAPGQTETRLRRKDGRCLWVLIESSAIFDDQGRYQGSLGMVMDVTERKRAEEALRASEQRLATIYRLTVAGVIVIRTADQRIVEVNDALLGLLGWSREEMLGRTTEELGIYPEPGVRTVAWREFHSQHRLAPAETRIRRKSGEMGDFVVSAAFAEIAGEACAVAVWHDVTELRRASAARRESEERLRQVVEAIQEVFWMTDPAKNQILYVSPAYERIWGRTCESVYRSPRDWFEAIHPEDRERVIHAATTRQADGIYDEEYRIVRPDGAVRWIRDRASALRDSEGNVTAVAGVAEDVTERRALAEQLRQAQKMEAIGGLAGGVAHDFNNLLSVILSYAALLRIELPDREELEEIEKAGKRAADLTRQLLAFSRRQILQPRIVDLNQIVSGMEKMLRRLIGEDIELTVVRSDARAPVYVDPGQIEQVIMNLSVNARDAMPQGGRLTLEVAPAILDAAEAARHPGVKPGPHAMLAVSDTGIGMDAATRARLFEPFFTTKEVGKGTGLGLATVFGIVRQSAGGVWVYSEPGKGATFKIYLPAAGGPLEEEPQRASEAGDLRGSETLLLVEDEDGVRQVVRSTLERSGYRVLEAQNGGEALLIAESQPAIDLLLTDVVMPRMSGPQLASRLRSLKPGIKVIYMSGYTDNAVVVHGVLGPETAFIQKPLTPSALLTKVREVLQAPQPVAAPAGKPRLLLVDDEPMMHRLVTHMLAGCHVEVTTRAQDALALIAGGAKFEVVLCDLNMGGMNGVDFYQALAAAQPELAKQVLFVTGGATDARAEQFITAMQGRVLVKPVDARTLRAAISKLLARSV